MQHDRTRFDTDELLQNAVLHWVEILGEAARGVSEKVRDAHPEVPWGVITGMRNRHQGADEGLPGGGADDSHDAAGHADGDDRRDGRLPGDGQCPQRGGQHTVSRLGDDKQPAQG